VGNIHGRILPETARDTREINLADTHQQLDTGALQLRRAQQRPGTPAAAALQPGVDVNIEAGSVRL